MDCGRVQCQRKTYMQQQCTLSKLKPIIEYPRKRKGSRFYNVLLFSWVLNIQILDMRPGPW